jgi:hypothetical protein
MHFHNRERLTCSCNTLTSLFIHIVEVGKIEAASSPKKTVILREAFRQTIPDSSSISHNLPVTVYALLSPFTISGRRLAAAILRGAVPIQDSLTVTIIRAHYNNTDSRPIMSR